MSSAFKQTAALEKAIAEEKNKTQRSLYILAAVYAVLVMWVFWDTSRVLGQIKAITAPDKVAALVGNQFRAQLPELQRQLTTDIGRQAPEIAAHITLSAHQAIPVLGELARRNVSLTADQIAQAMNEKHVPNLIAFLRGSLKDLPQNTAQAAANPEVTQRIAEMTVQAFDRELDQVLDKTLLAQLAEVKTQVDTLAAKPDKILNARERAEKTVLLNALYLVNHAQRGQTSLLAQGLRAVLAGLLPKDMFEAMDRPVSH